MDEDKVDWIKRKMEHMGMDLSMILPITLLAARAASHEGETVIDKERVRCLKDQLLHAEVERLTKRCEEARELIRKINESRGICPLCGCDSTSDLDCSDPTCPLGMWLEEKP